MVATVDVGLVACGRSNVWFPGDAYEGVGNDAGKGGGAGKGALTGGTGGTGGSFTTGGTTTTGGTGATGGSFITGGTGGGGNVGNGGTISSGGFPLGGMGPAAGVGGTAGAGPGPFACPSVPVTCDTFTNFSTDGTSFGSGTFTGGIAVFGDGLAYADGPKLHVTGTVAGYGRGIVVWFTNCADLSPFEGVTFTLDGWTSAGTYLELAALTNSDYPWQPRPQDRKGGCTASDPSNPWSECMAPRVGFALGPMPQVLYWGAFDGGTPVSWDDYTSPREIVGLQWDFPWDPGLIPYTVDVTLDDLSFIGGGMNDCGPGLGVGGMGGMGGFGGIGGNSSGGFAGSAGSAGMSGSGAGGMSGAGFGGAGSGGGGFNGGGFSGDSAGTSSGGFSGSAGGGGTSAGEGGFGGEGGA